LTYDRDQYEHDRDQYEQFDQEDDQEFGYEPPQRSPLVPILAIVASVLAVAVGIAVVLYAMGVFGSRSPEVAAPVSAPAPVAEPVQPPPPPPSAAEETPPVPDAVVAVAPPSAGEPPVRSTHGDWQVRCDTPAGAQNEQCVLMQFVTAEDRDNVGLTVIVLKTADRQARIMRVLAPLGVLLPSGLGLKVDATDIGRAGFVRCLPNGCVAEVILEDRAARDSSEPARPRPSSSSRRRRKASASRSPLTASAPRFRKSAVRLTTGTSSPGAYL
jgi:invasion protein IalB